MGETLHRRGQLTKVRFIKPKYILFKLPKYVFKFSTMVGENFEIYLPQMAKNAFKLSTMVDENFSRRFEAK